MADKTLARLVDLVPYISTHQGIAVTELASVFDVSVKQIESDLMTLFMCGYPFYQPMELHFDDGVVTISNADELSMVRKLSTFEVACLIIGLSELENSVSDSDISKLKIKLSKAISIKSELSDGSDLEIYYNAISNNEVLQIEYLLIDRDQISNREIIPVDMYQRSGNTYLKAYCLTSEALRTFRMDRILSMQQTGRSDSSHIPNEALDHSGEVGIEIFKQVRAVSEYFQTKVFDNTAKVKYYSRDWLVRSVMSLSGAVKVVGDELLTAEIAQRAAATRALYN